MSVTDTPRTEKQGAVKSPPQPIDGNEDDNKLALKVWGSVAVVVLLAVFSVYMLNRADSPTVNSAEDIAAVYDHAIILQAREGDTLETASLAVFPNTLIERRVREDSLSDEAKALERDRYQAEWQRLSRLLTGTTGTSLAAGEFFAVPAKDNEPGAIEVNRVSAEIRQLTQQATGG